MSYHFTYPRPMFRSSVALVCAGVWGLSSCSTEPAEDPPRGIQITSQGAALTAIENTEIALDGIVDSGGFLADSTSLAETLSALGGGSTSCSTTLTNCDVTEPDCVPTRSEVCTTDEVTAEDLQAMREDIREEIDKIVERLREEVFIEANLDAAGTNETQVTYRLGASVLCQPSGDTRTPTAAPGPSDALPPEPTQIELDPECVANAEKANLRVRLSQPNPDDVDVTFIVSNQNYEPLTLQLYHDRLGVKVDLAQGLDAMEAMGESVEPVDSLEGLLQLQLVKNAALDYSLQFSVLSDIRLSMSDNNGDNLAYSIGKSSPTVELNLNGNTKTIAATYNYGSIQWLAPLRMLASMFDNDDAPLISTGNDPLPQPEPEKEYTGMLEMLVSGYTGTVSYTADSDEFRFSNVSLGTGTSTLAHNGNILAALDLNPENARGFDMVIRATEDEAARTAIVSIDPTIDLNVAVNFSHVADQLEIPETLLNDKLRMWFSGDNPTFAVEDAQMRMVSGSFHMSSEQSPESNVDVAEGMCLVVDAEGEGSLDAPLPTEGDPTPEEEDTLEASGLFAVKAAVCQ